MKHGYWWAMVRREWRTPEVRMVSLAVLIAVTATTAVNFFTARVESALNRQANELLGGDLLVRSGRPLPAALFALVDKYKLHRTESRTFPSMVLANGNSQLTSVKTVNPGFPLRGAVRISDQLFAVDRHVDAIPKSGTIWVEAHLLSALNRHVGDTLQLGRSRLRIDGVLTHEPGRGGDMFTIAPRVLINGMDLPATGLLQPGSRVSRLLYLAGDGPSLAAFVAEYRRVKMPHQQLLTAANARPELRIALDRARQFLSLAALTAVIIAVLSIAVAVQSYIKRHRHQTAVLRALGARQSFIVFHYTVYWTIMATLVSTLGCLGGFAGQWMIAVVMASGFGLALPAAPASSWLFGWLLGMASVLTFVLPSVLGLRNASTMQLLSGAGVAVSSRWLVPFVMGMLGLILIVFWQTAHVRMTAYLLVSITSVFAVLAVFAWLILKTLGFVGKRVRSAWRFALVNPSRRSGQSVLQIVAFGSGLMALLLLNIVRNDLIHDWQNRLPEQAPNRFLINIQADQLDPLRTFFSQQGFPPPLLYPMVRGRLVSKNGSPMDPHSYPEGRAKRLLQREFNLSWSEQLPSHNRLVAGRWWDKHANHVLSVEQGLAELYGIAVGDTLEFDVAGQTVAAQVDNLRAVDWDSFKVNFFVITDPGLIEHMPASYVSSLYVAPGNYRVLQSLVETFPNITVIDVAAIMDHVRGIIDRVARAVAMIFVLTLCAGLLVMSAALHASRRERLQELTLLRVLGAGDRQLRQAWYGEWLLLGGIASVSAGCAAALTAYTVAYQVMNIHLLPGLWQWVGGMTLGVIAALAFAWLGGRALLRQAIDTRLLQ